MSGRLCYLASLAHSCQPSYLRSPSSSSKEIPAFMQSLCRQTQQHLSLKPCDLSIPPISPDLLDTYRRSMYTCQRADVYPYTIIFFLHFRTIEIAHFTRIQVRCPVFEPLPRLRSPSSQHILPSTARCPADLKARNVNQGIDNALTPRTFDVMREHC
jgi:hypothetical protein